MTLPVPVGIARRETEPGRPPTIEIVWSDGLTARYSPRLLRDACPCASCRETRAAPVVRPLLPVLEPRDTLPLAVAGMTPVGQYAYAIEFSDGHTSGIYTLDYLRELAERVTPA
ncbi:MAG: DUF971 domain-containing protein [Planctomycetes bacterium]|nr:DUF971 domain-containing protein [Planctomycetota bacterium]